MTKKNFIGLIALLVAIPLTKAEAQTQPDYIYTTGNISVGNAGSECAQLGSLLGVEFVYAYKFNEDGDEGATNETETADFFDPETLALVHSNDITISNSDGSIFNWSADNSIGAVLVKAGTGYNVYYYDPQSTSDTGLIAYEGRGVSHVTFCWNPDNPSGGEEWCSPGYWRQPHHLDSWDATGYSTTDSFEISTGQSVMLSRKGEREGANEDPTLLEVLQYPQYYGGDAFNAVGDLLSYSHPDVDFDGNRIEDSCPLN